MRTFCSKMHVRSVVRTFLGLLDICSVMRTEMVQIGKWDLNADRTAKNHPVHTEVPKFGSFGSDIRRDCVVRLSGVTLARPVFFAGEGGGESRTA